MKLDEVDLLANRLNYDAVVFKSCTTNEMLWIAMICISISCVLLGFIIQVFFGNFIYGVSGGFLAGGGLTYIACCVFEKIRRGQEKGYIQQLISLKLYRAGFVMNKEIIRRSGSWMIGHYF